MNNSKLQNSRKGTNQLQFLRFIAFFNIFLWHADQWNVFGYPTRNASLLSVSFFFMLSGFLAGYNGYGREQKPRVKDIVKYIWNKIKKIYPIFFFIQVVWLLPSGIMTSLLYYKFDEVAEYLKLWVKHLLLIQSWLPVGYFSFANVCWFFSTIFFLYLFNLPAVYLLNKVQKRPKHSWILGGAFLVILLGTIAFHYFTQNYSDIHFIQYVFPPARLGEYLSSMVLGFVIRQWKPQLEQKKKLSTPFTILEIVAFAFWFAVMWLPGDNWMNRVIYWLVPNMLLLSIFALGFGKVSSLLCWKPLVGLGDITAECVLMNQTAIFLYSCFSGIWIADTKLIAAVSLMFSMVMSLLMAILLRGKRQ